MREHFMDNSDRSRHQARMAAVMRTAAGANANMSASKPLSSGCARPLLALGEHCAALKGRIFTQGFRHALDGPDVQYG